MNMLIAMISSLVIAVVNHRTITLQQTIIIFLCTWNLIETLTIKSL